jgi:hypothetical protein
MSVVDDSFEHSKKPEEKAVMSLAGGFMGYGYQCGMLWGATLAAGAQAFRLFGASPKAETEAVLTTQSLVKAFLDRNKHINCSEITEMNWKESSRRRNQTQALKFILRGGPIACFSMSASYSRTAFNVIDRTLSDGHGTMEYSPASCAALLAKKLGASDEHAVMAAGFAGGIGLSGGACGALGARIWISGINSSGEVEGQTNIGNFFNDPVATEIIERFLVSSDYEFECAKIVGKKFKNVADHAEYLRTGGCSNIIEALAA